MTALKDSAAFGRQSSYTLGEAVQSAAEGLKNENSILVDNAGVTKNVAQMWKEYAASIGTTTDKLTQQQKIQAEVNGILEETKFQTGDAAKMAGQYSGQVAALAYNMNALKVAAGNAIKPIAQAALPTINAVIEALTRLANLIATVSGALFGKATVSSSALAAGNAGLASSAAEAAAAEEALANSTAAAAKEAKGALAGFDELNVLQQDAGSSSGSSGDGSASGAPGGVIEAGIEVEDTVSPKLQSIIDKIHELIEPLKQIDLGPLKQAFEGLKEALVPLTRDLFAGLEWAWHNLFVPLAAWTVEDALPAFLNLLAAACRVLAAAIDALRPLGQWLWDNFLQPIAAWTGGVIISVLEALTDVLNGLAVWISENQEPFDAICVTIATFMGLWKVTDIAAWVINAGGVVGILGKMTDAIYAATIAKLTDKAVDLQIIALYAVDFVRAIAAKVLCLTQEAGAWAIVTAWKLKDTAVQWAQIAATTAWNAACAVATTVTTAFGAAVAFLTSPIGLVIIAVTALIAVGVLLYRNWDTIGDGMKQIWDGITSTIKGAVNGILGFINGMIAGIVSGLNTVIEALNGLSFTIPDWVPQFGGKDFGFTLSPLEAPQIPYLAQGAVIPPNREFLAVLGDQSSGTNVEAPLDTIKQAVAETLAGMGAGEREIVIRFAASGGLEQLVRLLKPYIDKENTRAGARLITGGVYG
ncbi:MAG: hypothetical protein ACI4OI_01075 [Gemmiger sp.]